MKTKLYMSTVCLLICFSSFSQTTSQGTESRVGADTLYSVTAEQLRATVRIFAEHGFLKSENALLQHQVSLLNRSGRAKDLIIQSQAEQIGSLHEIVFIGDAMQSNSEAAIEALKKQLEAERRKRKMTRWVAGVAVVGAVLMSL